MDSVNFFRSAREKAVISLCKNCARQVRDRPFPTEFSFPPGEGRGNFRRGDSKGGFSASPNPLCSDAHRVTLFLVARRFGKVANYFFRLPVSPAVLRTSRSRFPAGRFSVRTIRSRGIFIRFTRFGSRSEVPERRHSHYRAGVRRKREARRPPLPVRPGRRTSVLGQVVPRDERVLQVYAER